MNRRSFFGTLLAAPTAAVMALKTDAWPVSRDIGKTWCNLRPAGGPTFESLWKMIEDFEGEARTVGSYMPKTKPYIDEQWRRYAEALRREA